MLKQTKNSDYADK
ncbi:TPA: 23S rRNA methyltransferase attenuation leader peptide [Streptococcus suis]|nr:23S rRNA methyltransferase attenuation leader peptide [Streptococcus suis]HEM3300845.1 23S rRNA methyltransferase attenuation leader peptide [Streptococcus suis]HEM3302836.1 23S rRNA methyltransferase attenuation leader peptide [Streptococcus suis]HEM4215805.1 23S rRNA methyltransferase attenuation leader peptide [Streptococcus suis]